MAQNISHCALYIFIPHLRPQEQTYSRTFPQIDCFSFSKYTANNNNREPVGKSEGMKNARITYVRQAIPHERISQQTLSLGTLKWQQASTKQDCHRSLSAVTKLILWESHKKSPLPFPENTAQVHSPLCGKFSKMVILTEWLPRPPGHLTDSPPGLFYSQMHSLSSHEIHSLIS